MCLASPPNSLTDLPRWFEGAAFMRNVSFLNNTFYYGAGVNTIHPSPVDTADIVERGNLFL